MGFLHSSRAPGRIPKLLKAAAQVRYLGHRASGKKGTLLRFEVPTFGSVASELFDQKLLWEDGPREDQTAFDLLSFALHDVRTKQLDSSRYDPGLLRRIGGYRTILQEGLDSIGLGGQEGFSAEAFDTLTIEAASDLRSFTPPERRVRVTGCLDLMGASQSVLKLQLRPGLIVTALWTGSDPIEKHRDLFNKEVVVEGLGIFRPSGTLLRIDADAIVLATVQDDFFRTLPKAVPVTDHQKLARLRPGVKSGYAAIKGIVPAEESDEDFIAALEALR